MLRQSLLLEAKDLDLAIKIVVEEHSRCCREGHSEHCKLLREEHGRLARQHETKQKEISTLTNSLVESALQRVSFLPAQCCCVVSLRSCCFARIKKCHLCDIGSSALHGGMSWPWHAMSLAPHEL